MNELVSRNFKIISVLPAGHQEYHTTLVCSNMEAEYANRLAKLLNKSHGTGLFTYKVIDIDKKVDFVRKTGNPGKIILSGVDFDDHLVADGMDVELAMYLRNLLNNDADEGFSFRVEEE
jgi:hypothetical protein